MFLTMIKLTQNTQLFLDDVMIAGSRNIRREIQTPEKHPDNPMIVREHPWEKNAVQVYGTVLPNEESGGFHCWYFASEQRDPDDVPWLTEEEKKSPNGTPPKPKKFYKICYAESEDGIHWRKSMLNAIDYPLYDEHNILIDDLHSACVHYEPHDPDEERRYKILGGRKIGFSRDGIHWNIQPFNASGKNDTGSSVARWKGEYMAFIRNQEEFPPDWPLVRTVALSTSTDFLDWTTKRTVFNTDEKDGFPWTQPYGMSVFPYGEVLIGIPWLIHLDRIEETEYHHKYNNRVGDMSTQLTVSRDGRNWERVADRVEFLKATEGAWDSSRVWPATRTFCRDGRVQFYYTGTDSRHGEGLGEIGIGLATLPEDRFVAVCQDNPAEAAELETPPLELPEGELLVNFEGEGLAVGLSDGKGNPISGFEAGSSRMEPRDQIRWTVRWGSRTLANIDRARPVSLLFSLGSSKLYSFRVTG